MNDMSITLVSIVVGGAVGVWISHRLKKDAHRDRLLNLIGGFKAEIKRISDEMGDANDLADPALHGTKAIPRLHPHLHAAVAQTTAVDPKVLPLLLELDRHLEDLGAAKVQWDSHPPESRAEALARMNASWEAAKERLAHVDKVFEDAEDRLGGPL